jgi:hypothetical protein
MLCGSGRSLPGGWEEADNGEERGERTGLRIEVSMGNSKVKTRRSRQEEHEHHPGGEEEEWRVGG